MIFVDSGFFLAFLDPRDSLHELARSWGSKIKEDMVVTEYVICETVNFCSKPINRPRVHALVKHIRSNPGFIWVGASEALFAKALALHNQRQDKEWSLTDCASFSVMEERGIKEALTYDHHFEQAGFTALLRLDALD